MIGGTGNSPESWGVGEVLASFMHSSKVRINVSHVAVSKAVDSSSFWKGREEKKILSLLIFFRYYNKGIKLLSVTQHFTVFSLCHTCLLWLKWNVQWKHYCEKISQKMSKVNEYIGFSQLWIMRIKKTTGKWYTYKGTI